MGPSNQGKQGITTQFRTSGRGFAAVDPERQREIDLEHARMIAKRVNAAYQGSGRQAPLGWLPSYRDAADEGGSVRRSR